MSLFTSASTRERRHRRRSELALLGIVGVVGYLGLSVFTTTGGAVLIRVALGLSIVVLVGLIGLLCWRARDPEARRRLAGLVRHAQPRRGGSPDENLTDE